MMRKHGAFLTHSQTRTEHEEGYLDKRIAHAAIWSVRACGIE